MGKAPHSLLITFFILSGLLCYSQTSVKVSDPILEMVGNNIHISYDILNGDPDERYTVSIVIKDEEGNIINASALDGDIGEDITAGRNKQITWNLETDKIFIEANIFVQINAKIVLPPAPITNTMTYNRTRLILQSLAFPGLGLSRVTGKPHWIRGVAGYGCLAGAIVLNQQAKSTYNGIEDLVYFDETKEAYDKSVQQQNTSDILLYTAVGIWIADFIWTLVGTSDLKKKPNSTELKGFSIGSSMEPLSYAPMLSVRYRF